MTKNIKRIMARTINVRAPRSNVFNHVRRNTAARRITEAVRAVGRIRRARRAHRRGPTGIARTAAIGQFRRNWAARRVTAAVRGVGNIRRALRRSAPLTGIRQALRHRAMNPSRSAYSPQFYAVRDRRDPTADVMDTYDLLNSVGYVSRWYNPSMASVQQGLPFYTDSNGTRRHNE